MCFHFPLMPRMFMAVRREQRYPITEILSRTPAVPDGCQWGIFLRNHDELTLEMVTDEERDYMWTEYARDPRMKRNLGIGRRLAPLVENDRRIAELLHALLFSFPGSPVLYYGDEIGMGDNIYLGDRDAVRTPMQWSPDRNAGFSRADFAQLYLPPLMDPVYGFQAVNVEAGTRNTSSQLHWMKRMLEVRKQHPVFGTGRFEVLQTENPSVLAYIRAMDEEDGEGDVVDPQGMAHPSTTVLCVCNLSRFAQPAVDLDDDPVVVDQRRVGLFGCHRAHHLGMLVAAGHQAEQPQRQLGVDGGVVVVARSGGAEDSALLAGEEIGRLTAGPFADEQLVVGAIGARHRPQQPRVL